MGLIVPDHLLHEFKIGDTCIVDGLTGADGAMQNGDIVQLTNGPFGPTKRWFILNVTDNKKASVLQEFLKPFKITPNPNPGPEQEPNHDCFPCNRRGLPFTTFVSKTVNTYSLGIYCSGPTSCCTPVDARIQNRAGKYHTGLIPPKYQTSKFLTPPNYRCRNVVGSNCALGLLADTQTRGLGLYGAGRPVNARPSSAPVRSITCGKPSAYLIPKHTGIARSPCVPTYEKGDMSACEVLEDYPAVY